MTPENSVTENSIRDEKLDAALEALESVRELQKFRRSHGVERIHLLVEDVAGDWLEQWGNDEYLDSEEFQDELNFLAAIARREEFQKEIQIIEGKITETDLEIQKLRERINRRIQCLYDELPVSRPIETPRGKDPGKLPESQPLLVKNISKINTLSPLVNFQPTAEDYFRLGYARIFEGLYERAISDYDRGLELEPFYAEIAHVYLNKGVAFHLLQKYEEAIKTYDEALGYNEDFLEAWNNRGAALFELSRYEEAIASFEKAIELNPKEPKAWNDRGIALSELEQYEEAIASHEKAIELSPNYPSAWNNKGFGLSKLGRYKEAILSYRKAIELEPGKALTWFNKASSHTHLGETNEAIEDLQKAIALDPSYREKAQTDPDFDTIRNDDRFQRLLASDDQS
jgi:tetratricopeptide (TPR) repeat protein